MPRMAFSGVRISWLMFEMKEDFALSLARAASRARLGVALFLAAA